MIERLRSVWYCSDQRFTRGQSPGSGRPAARERAPRPLASAFARRVAHVRFRLRAYLGIWRSRPAARPRAGRARGTGASPARGPAPAPNTRYIKSPRSQLRGVNGYPSRDICGGYARGSAAAFFCFRFVFSPRSELTVKGGWAGVKVTPASEVSERASLAPVASRRESRRVRWESAPPRRPRWLSTRWAGLISDQWYVPTRTNRDYRSVA
jgi:hypothetical protein